jgi:hypothetical protein
MLMHKRRWKVFKYNKRNRIPLNKHATLTITQMLPKLQQPIADLFPMPDALNDESIINGKPGAPKPPRPSKPKSATVKGQAYLPGLSRRGRPRKKDALEPSVRAAKSRKKRLATGAKRIELMLPPEIAIALDALASHFKESRVDLVSRLINKAAKRTLATP